MNKMKIPKITWAQNDEYILLDIHLDKSDNEIKINENNIFFKQGDYCCDLNLFDNIIVNESKYSEKRIYEFKLKKQNNDEWKQLLLNKNDYKANISVNWDKWDEEIDEEDNDNMMGGGMPGLEQMMAGMGGGSMPNMEEMMSQMNNGDNPISNQCMPCSEQNPNEDNDNDDDDEDDEDEDYDKYINIDEDDDEDEDDEDEDEDEISDSSDSSDKSLKTHNWDEYENKGLI